MADSRFSRTEWSWIFYDWANSAYSIIVTTALFPLFYQSLTTPDLYVSTWAFANSATSLVAAVLAPFLGTIADYRFHKKRFFSVFFGLGVAATAAMAFIGDGNWLGALVVYGASGVGFSAANLFYDAFLVDVTTPQRMDRVSASGFGWGYIGSCIPFVASIVLVLNQEALGFASLNAVYRTAFLITAAWWAVFSIPLLRNVKQVHYLAPSPTPIRDSLARLRDTLRDIRRLKPIFTFLLAYMFYIEGVNTIIRMATPIAVQMGIEQTTLIIVLLAIQIVAFPFAILYGRLAGHWSARRMLFIGIGVYFVVVLIAFFMPSMPDAWRTPMFWVLSMLVASSQGGIQGLSRSYYGKLIPAEKSAEFFGMYDILGKSASIVGPLMVGLFTVLTGQERWGILSILLLFGVGAVLLRRTPQ